MNGDKTPNYAVDTLLFDRRENKQIARLQAALWLPIGADFQIDDGAGKPRRMVVNDLWVEIPPSATTATIIVDLVEEELES